MGTGGSSRGYGTISVPTSMAEINVTPLVDVMLVLLIVFMVTAPLMQQGVQVDLPRANAGTLSEVPDQILLVVNKSKQILINGNAIRGGTLRAHLQSVSAVKPGVEVFIQGDQGVSYGFIAQVMAEVKKSGIQRVGLVTEPGDPNLKL